MKSFASGNYILQVKYEENGKERTEVFKIVVQ